VAGNILAGGGRANRALVDLTVPVDWETILQGVSPDGDGTPGIWPASFEFVYDLATGSILKVSSPDAAGARACTDAPDTTDSDIEPIVSWAYLRPEDGALESVNPRLATAGGSAGVASVFADQIERLWAYLRREDGAFDSSLDPTLTTEDGGVGAPLFANQLEIDFESGVDKIADPSGVDNWPPAGWTGFDKTTGVGASESGQSAAPVQKWPPLGATPAQTVTTLIGTDGDDVIDGTTGNDFINGLDGDDVLDGDSGDDTFHFVGNFGQDVVIGFAAGSAGGDVIAFAGVFTDVDEVLAASLQVGPNVLIEVDDQNGLALVDVALASLNRDDFRFV